ncbi:MAG: DUF1460 domain-containing protein [Gammaproteobacteria bacterium]|nr:DUF1460 domain-containing protein [Gammaproteobacteria bacterium]
MPNYPMIVPLYSMTHFNEEIESIYHSMISLATPQLKLMAAASVFLERPYFFEPLGEGLTGKYDQYPLYRTDLFDCVTYLDTVLTLLNSTNLLEFQQNILRVRYQNGVPAYQYRTDWFTDLEWLPNARALGWISDITPQMQSPTNQPLTAIAKTVIDKPRWYQVKSMRALHHTETLPKERLEKLLIELRNEGNAFAATTSEITYIPSSRLIDFDGKLNIELFQQIPSGTVVVFVRPDWAIRDHFKDYPDGYGTNLNVCHVGLLLWKDDTLMLYNASASDAKVLAIPLADYLKRHLTTETIKGIHLEKIIF